MRRFSILSVLALSTLTLSACSDANEGLSIGSRDDIVISNRGIPTLPDPQPVTEVNVTEVDPVKVTAPTDNIEAMEDGIAAVKAEAQTAVVDEDDVSIAWEKTEAEKKKEAAATEAKMKKTAMSAVPPAGMGGDVPPNAKPGECYAKVLIPAKTKTYQERVQVSEEQRVLARIIPAQYEVKAEQILIRAARQYWKKGTGPVQKMDEATGEIMCLVEEPAEYKTIEKRILVAPEKPEYKTVPAQFATVTKTNTITAERLEWRRILCETNMGTQPVTRIQQALNNKGYDLTVDGVFGSQTIKAIADYQTKNGLATRGITYETLEHLGVKLIGA